MQALRCVRDIQGFVSSLYIVDLVLYLYPFIYLTQSFDLSICLFTFNMNPETHQTRPYCSSDLALALVLVPALVIVPGLVPELEPGPVHVLALVAGPRNRDSPLA